MQRILITGGNGYIASRVASRYLSESSAVVMLWLHANSASEFETKKAVLNDRFQQFGERVEYYWGDLGAAEPFQHVDPSEIDIVLHAAAITKFNVEQALAQRINVEGSQKLFQFCTRCPQLKRLVQISTVYSSGMRSGLIEEQPLDDRAGFANYYESSKWSAETTLLTQYPQLPWQILRVATIIADDENAAVTQYNAFHNTLKLLYYGLLPVLPGKPTTPLYFVTAQFVVDAIVASINNGAAHSIYHVAHTREESISLGTMVDLTFDAFSRDAAFHKRRVLPPLYTDQASFESLDSSVQDFGSAVTKQALASVAPFSRQLFLTKELRNAQLVATLRSYRAPDQKRLVTDICEHLIKTRWGREAARAT